jgi:hypothetical protein
MTQETASSQPSRTPDGLIRLVGAFVFAGAVVVAMQVVGEAWVLLGDDSFIVEFAHRVDQNSGIDSAVQGTMRLSYFAAWIITAILLSVIGRLAIVGMIHGGKLALRRGAAEPILSVSTIDAPVDAPQ